MVLLDARPPGLDSRFRPGNTFTCTLTWPGGALAGRSFSATLDAAALAVDVVGDVMTITASAAQTTAAASAGTFMLTETTGGADQVLIIGDWHSSTGPAGATSAALPVTTDGVPVDVAVAAALASPEITHNWVDDGWTPFVTQLVNDGDSGGASSQALSVVGGRGRITNSFTDGNVRVAYERLGTDWADSEVCALWFGGSIFDSGTATPQMGHFHRGYVDEDGRWRAVVVSNNIFLTDVNVLNQNVWNHDPSEPVGQAQLDLGTNSGSKTYSAEVLRRHLQVRAVDRVVFGGVSNRYWVLPSHAYGLVAGNAVTIDVDDATYDVASATALGSVDAVNGLVSLTDAEAGPAEPLKVNTGTVVPTTAGARRWWPYWVRSQLIGSILRVKVWRYQDPEPDWSDTNHVATADFAGANDPEPGARMPTGVGRCGLVGAHIRNSAFVEYGHFSARQL